MKINSKKYLIALISMACFFFTGYQSIAQTTLVNFSGSWVLNEDKSDFGRLTAASASTIKKLRIEQSPTTISLKYGDSTTSQVIALNLNGQPVVQTTVTLINEIPNTFKKTYTLQIVTGKSFIATMADPVNLPSSSVRTFVLSDEAQTLTIAYKNTYGTTVLDGKLIYDKKKS